MWMQQYEDSNNIKILLQFLMKEWFYMAQGLMILYRYNLFM